MIEALSRSQQRGLAIGLLLVLCVSLALVVFWPVMAKHNKYDEIIDELEFRIKRYKRVILIQDQVFNQVEITRVNIAEQGYISDKEIEALASADLEQFLKNTITAAGGKLTSRQVLPSVTDGELTRISVKIRLTGTIEMLRDLVYQIEKEKPLLIIKQIDINPQRGKRNRTTRKFEESNQLNINLMVIGYMGKID